MTTKQHFNTSFWILIIVLFQGFLFQSCTNKDKPDKIAAVANRANVPSLHAEDVSTIISDSGVSRYRISAPLWEIYDKCEHPHQLFKKGIRLERFDENLKVDANIRGDYAYFDERKQLWELDGNVKAINLQGEVFETEQLFWDEVSERIYSDKYIKITQVSHIITGIGFESNQSMTRYQIKNPQGIFPMKENEEK
jgi:LPS export ABC transporter protein LptC